jgi:hypothetical protein
MSNIIKKCLKIKTCAKYFTSIFERVYVMEISHVDSLKSLISLRAYNKTRAGGKIGNSCIEIIKNMQVDVCKIEDSRLFIAELALKEDLLLKKKSLDQHERTSIYAIRKALVKCTENQVEPVS